jgi:hypothetical protein
MVKRTAPDHSLDVPVLGLRTRFRAADPALLAAASAAYQAWRSVAMPVGGPALRVRLRLRAGAAAPAKGVAPHIAVRGSRLALHGPGVRGGAYASRQRAVCVLAPGWLAEPHRLADEILDTLVLFLATALDRVPLHAAGVMIGDTAALLLGPGGSGKSTLALQAAREGLPVLSDDVVYLQRRPEPRVWGFPRPIHLLPEADAAPGPSLRFRAGRWKERITHASLGAVLHARSAALFVLEPGETADVQPLTLPDAAARIGAALEPGFDRFAAEVPEALRAVATRGAWRLTLSRDPADGIAAVRAALAGIPAEHL